MAPSRGYNPLVRDISGCFPGYFQAAAAAASGWRPSPAETVLSNTTQNPLAGTCTITDPDLNSRVSILNQVFVVPGSSTDTQQFSGIVTAAKGPVNLTVNCVDGALQHGLTPIQETWWVAKVPVR